MTGFAPISILVFAAFMLVGGIIGFVKGKSKPSLISGLTSAILLALCYFVFGDNSKKACTVACVICGLLVFIFGIRFSKTKKFMPAGLLLGASLIELGIMLAALMY